MTAVVAAACVVLATVAVVWPGVGRWSRQRRILALAAGRHSRRFSWSGRDGWVRQICRVRLSSRAGRPTWSIVDARPATVLALAFALPAAAGMLLGSVVAGGVAGAYGVVAARLLVRRRAERGRSRQRAGQLDLLAAAAAELRAGLPAGTALAGLASGGEAGDYEAGDRRAGEPLRARVRAAVVLAERTGAPLADVLERIEADARGAARARAASAAQTAGSRATAWLLAGLPLGGIALGYAIGADPLTVLLSTSIGAACAFGAVTLQLAGLGWADRITRGATAAAP